jgi:hypothetical protein
MAEAMTKHSKRHIARLLVFDEISLNAGSACTSAIIAASICSIVLLIENYLIG